MKKLIKDILSAMEDAKNAVGTKQKIGKEKDGKRQYYLSVSTNQTGTKCFWSLFVGSCCRITYNNEGQYDWVVADIFEHYIKA